MRRLLLLTTAGLALGATPTSAAARPPDPVVTWNRELLTIVRTPAAQPATVHPTRSIALRQASTATAVAAIDPSARPLLVHASARGRATRAAAIDAAAHDVLVALY